MSTKLLRHMTTTLLAAGALMVLAPMLAARGTDDLGFTGQWYGTGFSYVLNAGDNVAIHLDEDGGYAVVHIPPIGLSQQVLPAAFHDDAVVIWAGEVSFTGTLLGDHLYGFVWSNGFLVGEWETHRAIADLPDPGPGPGPALTDLPPLYCVADADQCSELVPFDPDEGPGYIDYPMNGETGDDQYRSYLRRDLMLLVKYAAAKVEALTTDWGHWPYAPIGLIDMSEADGSIPGTSVGAPGHPLGTHEGGKDIDIAYFQLYAQDNFPRPVGDHFEGFTDVYHCVGEPYALDPWRTALFIACLAEHPRLRVIVVDGQVGLVLEQALDELVTLGWIDADLRASIPLHYDVTGAGGYEFLFHHHHMHVSLEPTVDVLSEVDLDPNRLNLESEGQFVTGYVEIAPEFLGFLDVGRIDVSTVALLVDGHTLVPADPDHWAVGDRDSDGVPDLMVKFDRGPVIAALAAGKATLAITGLVDDGTYAGLVFQGTDEVTVF